MMKIFDTTDLDFHQDCIEADFTAWCNTLDYLALDADDYAERIKQEIMELVRDQQLIDQLREARESWKRSHYRRQRAGVAA